MTKRELFHATINSVKLDITLTDEAREEMIAGLYHEIDLLDKKVSSKKPTATQLENEIHVETIRAILEVADRPMSIKEIKAEHDSLADFTSSKMSALLRKLPVEKTYIKKVVHYALA